MAALRAGWNVQVGVLRALVFRELITRYGRENIGFLWMMLEPLMFASLVGIMWTVLRGPTEHQSISTAAFVATGYIPLTLFRHMVSRASDALKANASLLYHRQVRIVDLIVARFIIEVIGGMTAFLFIGTILVAIGLMPVPREPFYLMVGWSIYCGFTLSVGLIVGPLSTSSDILEKFIPVITYIMIPFSGAFTMNSWLTPRTAQGLMYSPFVAPMEMIRFGVFGDLVTPIYDVSVPIYASLGCLVVGLILCRRVRRSFIVE